MRVLLLLLLLFVKEKRKVRYSYLATIFPKISTMCMLDTKSAKEMPEYVTTTKKKLQVQKKSPAKYIAR